MKHTSAILLTASGAAVLAAVWAPGAWWQWGITALVLFLAGAGTGGTSAKREALHELAQAEQEAAEAEDRSRASSRKIEAAAEAERSRLGLQPRPTYGKKAGDQ